MSQHQCTKPCGSIDCAYGCITGQPWTGSEADSRVVPMMEPPDPIQQAVDRWIDMERKAKAWDRLQHEVKVNEQLTCASTTPEVIDWLDSLLDAQGGV